MELIDDLPQKIALPHASDARDDLDHRLAEEPPDSVEVELTVVHETCLSEMESSLYIENVSTAVRSASPFWPLVGV
jgi:hypothetical protein